MKNKFKVLLVLILCISVLASCTPKTPASNPDPQPGKTGETEYYDTISVYLMDKIALIDPFNPGGRSTAVGIVNHMLYDPLIELTVDNEMVPSLATEWSTEDSVHFHFKLREGVKFHNGEPFTADDVVFTVENAKANPGTTLYDQVNEVETVEAVNDYEVIMTLKAPNVDFFSRLASPVSSIMNRDAYAADPEKGGWVGTGPYTMSKFTPNDGFEVTKNDEYWGEQGPTKHFVFRTVAEETARLIMLENDEFTYCDINSVYIPQYSNDPRFVMNYYTMDNCNYVSFNMRKPLTGDKNFRMAVAYALDREEMMDIALGGFGKICETGALWGNKTGYKNMSLPLIQQDLDKAKEYLAKSSYKGEKVKITASMTHTIRAAEVLLSQLEAIGINAEVQKLDAPSMSAATAYESNDLDIIVGSGSWGSLASSCKNYFTRSNSNKACFENQEVYELLEKAAMTPDGEDRQAMYYRIQEIVADEIPYLGLFHMSMYIAAQQGTGGARYFPTNYHDYSLAYRVK